MSAGSKHYTKSGKVHTGPVHKMGGKVHTGAKHTSASKPLTHSKPKPSKK